MAWLTIGVIATWFWRRVTRRIGLVARGGGQVSEGELDMLAALRGRYTAVIVTHNLAQAQRIADEAAMFWSTDGVGTLVEHGEAARVFEAPASDITAAYLRGARG